MRKLVLGIGNPISGDGGNISGNVEIEVEGEAEHAVPYDTLPLTPRHELAL